MIYHEFRMFAREFFSLNCVATYVIHFLITVIVK